MSVASGPLIRRPPLADAELTVASLSPVLQIDNLPEPFARLAGDPIRVRLANGFANGVRNHRPGLLEHGRGDGTSEFAREVAGLAAAAA
jgi:hypothetical protein